MALTPTAMDGFSRFMVGMFDEKDVIGVTTGFQAFFGNPAAGSRTIFSPDANAVDIDIIRGNEKTAALIPRGTVSQPLGSTNKSQNVEKYSSFSRKYPLAEEEGDITGDQILNRVAGENPFEVMDRTGRMRILAKKIYDESIRRIVRMQERLAAQSMIFGIQDAIIGTSNTDLQYDFLRASGNTITPGTKWDNSGDILGDIDEACNQMREQGRITPDFIGIGTESFAALIADTTVQSLADNRRFELIDIGTNTGVPAKFSKLVAGGWIARGRLRTPEGYELWMFTMVDGFDTEAGTFTAYMPKDKAIITSVGARFDRYFGPPEMLPIVDQRIQLYQQLFGFNPLSKPLPPNVKAGSGVIEPRSFYADAYISADWKKLTVRTQAAPIFATTQTDAVVTLAGLVTL